MSAGPGVEGMRTVFLTRRQARLMLPLGLSMALSLTGDLTMYAVLANQIELLGITVGMVGVLLGVNRLIRIPGNMLAGALNDHNGPGLGRRRLFLVGLSFGIVATLSYGWARGFFPLLGGRLLWGCAWSLINVTGFTMVLDWSTPADRGRMVGFYQMAFMFGLAFSPLLGGTLTDLVGFRHAVRICAGVSATGLVLALLALPETGLVRAEGSQKWSFGSLHQRLLARAATWTQGPPARPLGGLRQRVGQIDRQILLASYIYMVTLFVSSGVMMSTIALYLGERWGGRVSFNRVSIGVATLSGFLLAGRALAGMAASPLAGTVSDRLYSRWPVIRVGVLLGMAGFIVLAVPAGIGAVLVGVLLVAISAAALAAALVALVGDLAPGDEQGRTMGALATSGDFGSTVGPFVAYVLATTLDLNWVYLLCSLALVSALIATIGQGKRT